MRPSWIVPTLIAGAAVGLLGLALQLASSDAAPRSASDAVEGALRPPAQEAVGPVEEDLHGATAPAAREADERRAQAPTEERDEAPASLVDGRVRVHGTVSQSGRPAVSYDLAFHAAGAGLEREDDDWDFTDEDGRYEVLLAPGSYLVLHDDEGPWLADVVVPADRNELRWDLELPPGRIRGRVLQAASGEALEQATVIALSIPDAVGSGLSRARVHADALSQARRARAGAARTGTDGVFELQDLRPGHYLVRAEHAGSVAYASVALGAAPRSGPEELVAEVELPLPEAGGGLTLRGVVRGPRGEPALLELLVHRGARASSLAELRLARRLRTGPDGGFVCAGLEPGPYLVLGAGATDGSALALRAHVDLRADAAPLELRASACGRLSIAVSSPAGAPVAGAHLDLRFADGSCAPASRAWVEEGCRSDEAGRIELDDLAPGIYRVAAGSPEGRGRLGRARDVEVRAGETAELSLVVVGEPRVSAREADRSE